MTAPPVITLIMITLGLGAVLRGLGAVIFARVPGAISLPIPADPIIIDGVPIATDKLVAAIVAALCIALVGTFYQYSRTGLALQALADDRQTAMSVGIDIDHHLLIVWAIAGVISVAAGVLWTFVSGGGFGVALVGLKVFPIVIIGGLDSILGAIVGAMIIGVLESLAPVISTLASAADSATSPHISCLSRGWWHAPPGCSAAPGSSGCSIVSAGIDAIWSTCFCGIAREHEPLSFSKILGSHRGSGTGGSE
jgi:branched-subunit amino acid ABC-type transport system permease component